MSTPDIIAVDQVHVLACATDPAATDLVDSTGRVRLRLAWSDPISAAAALRRLAGHLDWESGRATDLT